MDGSAVERLADRVELLMTAADRVLVGIDGPDAAGKTTLADRLADRLGAATVRASVDGFHRPRSVRYQRGELSPEGCYLDTFDTDALVRRLLEPFATGAGRVLTQAFDHVADQPLAVTSALPPSAALVVDGVFLLREQLRAHWTLSVYLHVSPQETLRRALVRDLGVLGGAAEVEHRYRKRYLAAQAMYDAEAQPAVRADVVIDNSDHGAPRVLRW